MAAGGSIILRWKCGAGGSPAGGLCQVMAAALALKIKTREQLDAEEAAQAAAPQRV